MLKLIKRIDFSLKATSTQQIKKAILYSDILSFTFGFCGICFGILSVLALEPFWNNNFHSFIFTATTIFFDTLSVLSAMFAYYDGTQLYKKTEKPKRNIQSKLLKAERYSYLFDFWSFLAGIVGLVFGIISFVTLFPTFLNESISWWITITSICFDGLSCSFVTLAMIYFQKELRLSKKM